MTRLERIGIAVFAALLAVSVVVLVAFPAGWWMQIHSLSIRDARLGEPIILDYNRSIRRNFQGEWRVEVWRADRGMWHAYCNSQGAHGYRANATIPAVTTLEWFVDGKDRCFRLPEGSYKVVVRIDINPDGLLDRSVEYETPAFEVGGGGV